jgi:hypothetical protein
MAMPQEMFALAARTRLIDALMSEGVNVALPIGAGEIDMLASVESPNGEPWNAWIPIKVVATPADALGKKLGSTRVPGLLVMLISSSGNLETVQTFALTSAELTVVRMIALPTRNSAESDCKVFAAARTAGGIFNQALEPFAIYPGQWRQKVMAALAQVDLGRGRR